MNPLEGVPIDWTSLLKSPIVLFIPVTVGCALVVWIVTEACSYFVPAKYRAAFAVALGPLAGWAVNRLELIDFGWGPTGWGRAVFFGFMAGALAVLGHDKIKTLPPFSWLAARTPSAMPVPVPTTPKGDS